LAPRLPGRLRRAKNEKQIEKTEHELSSFKKRETVAQHHEKMKENI
jgi:hypothetical protein